MAGKTESIPEIPSETSTPTLSSIGIPDFDMGPIRLPLVIPMIRSPGSLISELEAVDIPLPSSVPPRVSRPLPSVEIPQVPQPLPQPIQQTLPLHPQLVPQQLPSLPQPQVSSPL